MTTSPYLDHILDHATGLPGVDPVSHTDGTVELRVGNTLIGHIYDTGLVDLTFSRQVRDQLLTEGRADRHHTDPNSGWISAWVRTPEDVRDVKWLLRLAYLCHLRTLPDGQLRAIAPDIGLSTELDKLGLSTVLRQLVSRPAETAETPDTAQSA